jgi:hypothetical protein
MRSTAIGVYAHVSAPNQTKDVLEAPLSGGPPVGRSRSGWNRLVRTRDIQPRGTILDGKYRPSRRVREPHRPFSIGEVITTKRSGCFEGCLEILTSCVNGGQTSKLSFQRTANPSGYGCAKGREGAIFTAVWLRRSPSSSGSPEFLHPSRHSSVLPRARRMYCTVHHTRHASV